LKIYISYQRKVT